MVVEIFSFRNVEEIRIILYPRGKIILVARKCRNFCHYWSYVNKEKDKENKKKKKKNKSILFSSRSRGEMPVYRIPRRGETERNGDFNSQKKKKTGSIRCTQSGEERKKERRGVFPANINLKPLFDASLELLTRTPCCL